jgi:hypothetical protein
MPKSNRISRQVSGEGGATTHNPAGKEEQNSEAIDHEHNCALKAVIKGRRNANKRYYNRSSTTECAIIIK